MKVTKSQLKEIIKEELQTVMSEGGAVGHFESPQRSRVMMDAGLDRDEINYVNQILDDEIDSADFLETPAYEKLFEYFAFSNETPERMPYGTAKARDGMPDEWILDYLQGV
jgi:hypothetical protein